MDTGYATAWAAALTGGGYTQGIRRLVRQLTPGSMATAVWCPLGVLCDLVLSGGVKGAAFTFDSAGMGVLTASGADYNVPLAVRDIVDMQSATGRFVHNGQTLEICALNDATPQYTFAEIAALILLYKDDL